jgi:hypothetical protein
MNKLLRARLGRFADLVLRGPGNPVLLAPEICFGLFWLSDMSPVVSRISLSKPSLWRRIVLIAARLHSTGPLRSAIAGPVAIPGLFRRVLFRIRSIAGCVDVQRGATIVAGAPGIPVRPKVGHFAVLEFFLAS